MRPKHTTRLARWPVAVTLAAAATLTIGLSLGGTAVAATATPHPTSSASPHPDPKLSPQSSPSNSPHASPSGAAGQAAARKMTARVQLVRGRVAVWSDALLAACGPVLGPGCGLRLGVGCWAAGPAWAAGAAAAALPRTVLAKHVPIVRIPAAVMATADGHRVSHAGRFAVIWPSSHARGRTPLRTPPGATSQPRLPAWWTAVLTTMSKTPLMFRPRTMRCQGL